MAPEFIVIFQPIDDINIDSFKYTENNTDLVSMEEISYKYLDSENISYPVPQVVF